MTNMKKKYICLSSNNSTKQGITFALNVKSVTILEFKKKKNHIGTLSKAFAEKDPYLKN